MPAKAKSSKSAKRNLAVDDSKPAAKKRIKTDSKASSPAEEKQQVGDGLGKKANKDSRQTASSGDMFAGAHVSAAGGVHNAVTNAVKIGCKAFALFLKSQRQWAAKPLDADVITQFKQLTKEYGFDSHLILPHGSYLINCGSPDKEVLSKSRVALLAEMKRCEQLGLTLFNFHPGSTCGKQSIEKSVKQIADAINFVHTQTKDVVAVIENMSCQGHTLGGKFEEIRDIIDLVKDKTRVGVCIDTCHAFAAGFDLTTKDGYEDMWAKFESTIGWKYLKAMHLNDSKGDLGCHLDRHEKIGKGKIGKPVFQWIMNDSRLKNIPLILETPDETNWEAEIKLLYSFHTK